MRLRTLLLMLGCSLPETAHAQTTAAPTANTSAANIVSPALAPDYRLQPGDSFDVIYRYTPEYNQTATVQSDGSVNLIMAGRVPVARRTIEDARSRIVAAASKRLNEPEISLAIKDYEKPHFTVLGEVANPGRFELRGPLQPVDALAMAGGLKLTAKHTQIILIHRINETEGQAQLLNFRQLEKIRQGKEFNEFSYLRDGDLLIVPTSNFSKVERLVKLANLGLYYNPPL